MYTRGRDEKCIKNSYEKPEGRDYSEYLGLYGKDM
jgi:hypothetical protein